MSTIDLIFQNYRDETWLRGVCGAEDGRGPRKDGFGYFGIGRIGYPGDRRLELRTQLVARPSYLAKSLACRFPPEIESVGITDFGFHKLTSGRLVLWFPIEFLVKETAPVELQVLKLHDRPTRLRHDTVQAWELELESWVRLDPAPGRRPKSIREFDVQYWAGGLPSLGKR